MTATEIPTEAETTAPAVRWPLVDGHRLRATLGQYGVEWALVCPHGTPTVGNLANAPECRIKHDDEGEPIGLFPTCLLLDGWEGPDDNLHRPEAATETVLADLPIAWQWPLEDDLEVYPAELDAADGLTPDRIRYAAMPPIQLRDAALQLLGERESARATAVALEQQVDLLTRLIGHTAAVLARNGQPSTATELVRRAERITDPDAQEDRAAFLDRLDAELATLGPAGSAAMWRQVYDEVLRPPTATPGDPE